MRGLSENIRVRSIVGRFLEHARAFYFENDGADGPRIYLGSADWMPRNFFRRIEVLFPIQDAELRRWVTEDLLAIELQDNDDARVLHPNGAYETVEPTDNSSTFSAQHYFIAASGQRLRHSC
jgi:polyphosphate kinase